MRLPARLWALLKSQGAMALVGIASFALGAYSTWFYERKPELRVEILTVGTVFDVREPLPELDFLYAGKSLKASKEELRLVSLRVRNSGRATISRDDFDEREPLQLSAVKGRILNASTRGASSDYLVRAVRMHVNDATLRFAPLVLEAGEWFTVQLLILAGAGTKDEITVHGKVVGIIGTIPVVDLREETTKTSAWNRIVGADSWWIHLARVPVYFLGFFLLLLLIAAVLAGIMWPFIAIGDWIERKRRKRLIHEYSLGRTLSRNEHLILAIFRQHGAWGLLTMQAMIEALKKSGGTIPETKRGYRISPTETKVQDLETFVRMRLYLGDTDAEGIFRIEDDRVVIEPGFAGALRSIVDFLREATDFPKLEPSDTRFSEFVMEGPHLNRSEGKS